MILPTRFKDVVGYNSVGWWLACLVFLLPTGEVVLAEWTTVVNPNSGMVLAPKVFYDPRDGLVYIENDGPNGSVDSHDNVTLLGDDIGMISLLLGVNYDYIPFGDTDPVLPIYSDGIAWPPPTVFGSKLQLSGTAIVGSFLPISARPVAVAQLPTGLGLEAFQYQTNRYSLEMGVNFSLGAPGTTLFDEHPVASGNFRILPEPAGATPAFLCAAILGSHARKKKHSLS